jgi:hypothetical protein
MPADGDLWFELQPQARRGRGERVRRSLARAASRGGTQPRKARAVVREAFIQGAIFGFLLAAVVGYALGSALHW